MIKKFLTYILLVICTSCGFQPILKNISNENLVINKINYAGKNDLTYSINSYLNLRIQENIEGLNLNISIKESISAITKNNQGITTEESLEIIVNLVVKNKNLEIISNETLSSSKRLWVTNNIISDEELRKIERKSLLKELSQQIKLRLFIINQNIK